MVKTGEISEDVPWYSKYGWLGGLVDVIKGFFQSGGSKLSSVLEYIKKLWGGKKTGEPEIVIERKTHNPTTGSLSVPSYAPSSSIQVMPFTSSYPQDPLEIEVDPDIEDISNYIVQKKHNPGFTSRIFNTITGMIIPRVNVSNTAFNTTSF